MVPTYLSLLRLLQVSPLQLGVHVLRIINMSSYGILQIFAYSLAYPLLGILAHAEHEWPRVFQGTYF